MILNFQSQFAHLITAGIKTHTIRQDSPHLRKLKPGDRLFLFTGLRTKSCRNLIPPGATRNFQLNNTKKENWFVTCKSVHDIELGYRLSLYNPGREFLCIILDGKELNEQELQDVFSTDGFKSRPDFINFFKKHYHFPFTGLLIKW